MGGPTRKYNAVVNGTKTILNLSDADAKAHPGVIDLVDDKPAPAAKAEPGAPDDDGSEAKARRAPANKARRPAANKADG